MADLSAARLKRSDSSAFDGMRASEYGTSTQVPSPSKRHPWYGHWMAPPTTSPPPRWAPLCGQCASSAPNTPEAVRKTTISCCANVTRSN